MSDQRIDDVLDRVRQENAAIARNAEASERISSIPADDASTPDGEHRPERSERRPPAGKVSQASLLVDLAAEAELFHTPEHKGYAVIPVGGHREVWAINSGAFRRWLQHRFHRLKGTTPNSQALQDALGVLEGDALFAGDEHEVHVRLAEHDNSIYLDLGDASWQTVQITAAGWRIVTDPPIRFRRPRGMLALPEPRPGGDLSKLRAFINVSDDDWPLFAAWLVAALRPRGPFPVLVLHGEQGSAKSTTARVARMLIDPNKADLRAEPRNEHELMISAQNGWVVALDHLSHLTPALSDALCRLSTGGGFAARELYTDAEEMLFDAQRPLLITGIEELATRGDLLDRALILTLPRITEESRLDEETFWPSFEEGRSVLLGALLDALATALRRLPTVHISRKPRMADFARLATAAEPAIGVADGAFLAAYRGKRADAHELALEASPLTEPIRLVAAEGFIGTATELLAKLTQHAPDEVTHRRGWPANARHLSGALRRIAPNLRASGIDVTFDPPGLRRGIAIRTLAESSVRSVPTVESHIPSAAAQDATDATDARNSWSSDHATGVLGERQSD